MRQASLPPTQGSKCDACFRSTLYQYIRLALAQYYACDADYIVKIPDTISWEEAGCIQPLAVAIQVRRLACDISMEALAYRVFNHPS